jgi:hypothetical protein
MVFIELLKKYEIEIKEAVEELFEAAYKNQRIDTDLLLVIIHGYYDEKHKTFLEKEKLSPYVFGPAHIGYSLDSFYEFFHFYRTTHKSKKKFSKLLSDPATKEETEYHERLTLNLELMIYLKFWESDLLLRQLYNLVNLAAGKYYDWNFTPPDAGKKENSSGKFSRRPFIRNHIQTPMKTVCPKFHSLIEDNYSAQIRNSIAHSKYYFMGRNLQLANRDENKHYELHNIPFDDWEIRFHKTLLFYNFIIGNIQKFDKLYQDEVKDKHFGLPLSTPKLNNLGLRKNQWAKYDEARHRWLWATQVDD